MNNEILEETCIFILTTYKIIPKECEEILTKLKFHGLTKDRKSKSEEPSKKKDK
jgi:hypothetical protein